MRFRRDLVRRLAAQTPGGYSAAGTAASEPTALAGLALFKAGQARAAASAADWLVEQQASDGSIGPNGSQESPGWPTSLAMLLWQTMQTADATAKYAPAIAAAHEWALQDVGRTQVRPPWIGHDTMLAGWSWAPATHSWLEPTALFVLALKAVGDSDHPRTREAVRLLVDRLLKSGGCNYGNTAVLGQQMMAHVQPTGIVLMALADETVYDPRIARAVEYLQRELSVETTTASLCYGLLGLAAFNHSPADRLAWLEAAYERELERGASCYKLALLALASAESYPLAKPTVRFSRGEPKTQRSDPDVASLFAP